MDKINLKELFASIKYHDVEYTLIKTFLLLLISVAVVTLFYFLFSKVMNTKKRVVGEINTDDHLKYAVLWSIIATLLAFTIIILVLFYLIDVERINWADYRTYLAFFKNQQTTLFPYLVSYLGLALFYFNRQLSFNRIIKTF